MSMTHTDASGTIPSENANAAGAAAPGIADWLCLAAAPTFALMALLTILSDDAAMLCMGANASPLTGLPLTGMPAMYLLMSAFHLAPWLRVISGRQAQ
ncbi:conserved hypothetical protein [Mesorhizobium metallidurans STM 2683]|uniref:Uncharacterized protein n=1 Tax=Mesorhizobium metallidurans STM 2683 TaxID=1297569 RepID=M5EVC2_9HYPH|nr:hypothetical protein [Mesorhizobium metallidurans]CCV08197.1 conserved hypothetical protein [Mesorhizobium metallidurans STM 2683]